jgi:ABC-type enterobactin transport system permease subunit
MLCLPIATVSDGANTATYGYLANSDLLASTTFDAGACQHSVISISRTKMHSKKVAITALALIISGVLIYFVADQRSSVDETKLIGAWEIGCRESLGITVSPPMKR